MKKVLWALAFIAAVIVSSVTASYFTVSYYAKSEHPAFDQTLLGVWGFRALACGRGFQVVMASNPDGGGLDVKEGFLGHARVNGASHQDTEYLSGLFEDGRDAAVQSGFKEGIELDTLGTEMVEIIESLVDHGCGVDMHFLIERGWLFIGEQKEEIMNKLLNR